jgi:hypothetical protein
LDAEERICNRIQGNLVVFAHVVYESFHVFRSVAEDICVIYEQAYICVLVLGNAIEEAWVGFEALRVMEVPVSPRRCRQPVHGLHDAIEVPEW